MIKLKSVFTAAALLSTVCNPMAGKAQQFERSRVPDVSKMGVEFPMKRLLRSNSLPVLPVAQRVPRPDSAVARSPIDVRKSIIEAPVKRVISNELPVTSNAIATPVLAPPSFHPTSNSRLNMSLPGGLKQASKPSRPSARTGTKVAPGAVIWHPTFDQALKASSKSKKPVMLFHLMGNLDDRFC